MSADYSVEIEGAAEVSRALDKIAWATTPRGMHQVLKDAGMILRKRSMQAFRDESAPEYIGDGDGGGEQWEPLAANTEHARRKGRRSRGRANKILQDTGEGRRSIGIDTDVSDGSVAVGTAKQHMLYQQTGTDPYTITPKNAPMLVFMGPDGHLVSAKKVNHPGLPARAFLGYDKSDIESILKMTVTHLKRAAGGNRASLAALLA